MSNDMSMMTSMAISKATQGNLGSSQAQAKSLSSEQNTAAKEQELRKASQGFEAIFLQQIWDEMRSSMPENSMHGSKEEEYWQSMYSQRLGEDMAKSGGIGLADMMMEQLTRGKTQSPHSKNIFDRAPMTVSPAPLITGSNAPKVETQAIANNISTISNNSPVSSQNDDFYQDMDAGEQGRGMSSAGFKTSPDLTSDMKNLGNMEDDYYADSYAVENSRVNSGTGKVSTPQASSGLRQTIDELQALAAPASTEPTIIRTRYVSNLPASERENAILDRNGKITAKHMASLQPEGSTQSAGSMPLGNRERTMPQANNQINNPINNRANNPINNPMNERVNGQGASNQYMNAYPENLLPESSAQVRNNSRNMNIRDNSKLEKSEQVLNSPADLLTGIQTRYISQNQVQENPLHAKTLVAQLTTNTAANGSFFPSHAEVQAELNNLLERDSSSSRYGSMLASSTKINDPYSYGESMKMEKGNQIENPQVLASNLNRSRIGQMNSSNNDSQIPVFHTMPSLDDALQAGTLIASLSPEQIRATQLGQNKTNQTTPSLIDTIGSQNNQMRYAVGGPQISEPADALPQNKVSATSPMLSVQNPLVNGEISSGFGWRLDPFSQQRAWHTGLDIKASAGSSVNVVQDGVVSFAGKDAELGNMIIVDHGNGMESVYGHNGELRVKQGEQISSGTNIAEVGMSGRAAGAHLHFEIRHNGLPINPEPYLSGNKTS